MTRNTISFLERVKLQGWADFDIFIHWKFRIFKNNLNKFSGYVVPMEEVHRWILGLYHPCALESRWSVVLHRYRWRFSYFMKIYNLYLVMLDQLAGKCIAWSNLIFWAGDVAVQKLLISLDSSFFKDLKSSLSNRYRNAMSNANISCLP